MSKKYRDIVRHYEACLREFGDSHRGVDWPDPGHADIRYRVMLDLVDPAPGGRVEVLDFGCGAAHMLEYIQAHGIDNIRYSGLDISGQFISLSRQKFPDIDFYCLDILEPAVELPDFDYIVMNGVFTIKATLSFDEMFSYLKEMIPRVFSRARTGIAFNVMSRHVDRERQDLFHLSMDELGEFLTREVTRHFAFRHDYGLREYTVYLYKQARGGEAG